MNLGMNFVLLKAIAETQEFTVVWLCCQADTVITA